MAVNMEAVIELGARSGWGSAREGAGPHASAELDGDWSLAAPVGYASLVERIRQSEKAASEESTVLSEAVERGLHTVIERTDGLEAGRVLLRQYAELVLRLADELTGGNFDVAVEIAELSELLRGPGRLEVCAIEGYQRALQRLTLRFGQVTAATAWI